jgi:predicted phosphodiesterase
MRTIFFGDVHGDIYSLKKLFDTTSADEYICVGDLVGYTPHGEECLHLAVEKCGLKNIIAGNHEEFFLSGKAASSCSNIVHETFNLCYNRFNSFDILSKLNKLIKLEVASKKIVVSHTFGDRHIYPDSKINFDIIGDINIFGHTHLQFVKFFKEKSLICTGSLGQNKKQRNIAQYIVMDSSSNNLSIEYCSFLSLKNNLINDMRQLNYPLHILEYYSK